jgi:tetratricopeptide (TPR) repeat protein
METANLEQAQVSYNQGLAHLKSGNLDEVIECFREALLLNPNFAEVHNARFKSVQESRFTLLCSPYKSGYWNSALVISVATGA